MRGIFLTDGPEGMELLRQVFPIRSQAVTGKLALVLPEGVDESIFPFRERIQDIPAGWADADST